MMVENNYNKIALEFLERQCVETIEMTMTDKHVFQATFKFFGTIAASNRIGILNFGGDGINAFYMNLDTEMDERFTVLVSNLVNDLIIHLNSIDTNAYLELTSQLKNALTITINSTAFTSSVRERVDVTLLDDALYFTFFLLQPVLKKMIVAMSKGVARNVATTAAEHTN